MIFQSSPWKLELERNLRTIKNWSAKAKDHRGDFYIERGVFLSAFIIRKLMENRKVSDKIRLEPIECDSFTAVRPISRMVATYFGPSLDLSKDYDMSRSMPQIMSRYDLMSEIMHSYAFVPVIARGRWSAFLINSYRHRDRRILLVKMTAFERTLNAVISDQVKSVRVYHTPLAGKVVADVTGFSLQEIRRMSKDRRQTKRRS